MQAGRGGVEFAGDLADAYRACLWTRTANRILLPLSHFSAADGEALYTGASAIPWEDHLSPDATLAVDYVAVDSTLSHTQFGAQRVKDAVVDRLRARFGRRPSVEREQPALRINAHSLRDQITLSIDLSGASLHRRGYRRETVLAPLKENLAAAVLLKSGWAEIAAQGGTLLDPLCGSGTLLIEGAWIAADVAPGLLRSYWGFSGWRQYDPTLWEALTQEARQRREQGLRRLPRIDGRDADPRALAAARANIQAAGLGGLIQLAQGVLVSAAPPSANAPGLLITNPPYGERLGERIELETLYAELGTVLKARFVGWQAAVFTGNPDLGKRMGLRARKTNAFYNGALPCKLLQFSVTPAYFVANKPAVVIDQAPTSAGATMFANRLRKNLHTLGRWAKREGIECYRLYDADMPEYALAVDVYGDAAYAQEYAAPASIDPMRAETRLREALAVIPPVLGIPAGHLYYQLRRRQPATGQYQKSAGQGRFLEVREGPARFWVNLGEYLDTGLFLDHRPTRQRIGALAENRRFLNLFAYTATASVYAALGGATATTSVDLSATYLDWARRNFELNGIVGRQHRLIRADCQQWLTEDRGYYGLIFIDPPTFSNSKSLPDDFDVQRDHVALIQLAMHRLEPGGLILFSTHYRRFKMDRAALDHLYLEDITRHTIAKDFERNPRIHQCWLIRRLS